MQFAWQTTLHALASLRASAQSYAALFERPDMLSFMRHIGALGTTQTLQSAHPIAAAKGVRRKDCNRDCRSICAGLQLYHYSCTCKQTLQANCNITAKHEGCSHGYVVLDACLLH